MNMKNFALFLIIVMLTTSCTQVGHKTPKNQEAMTTPKDAVAQGMAAIQPPSQSSSHHTEKSVVDSLIPTWAQRDGNVYPLSEKGLLVNCESRIQDIINVLGKPSFVNIQKFPNRHVESQIDEIHELFFEGLSVFVYYFDNSHFVDDTSLIIGFTLTGKQYKLPGNIRIGSPVSQVKNYIRPLKRSKEFFLYSNSYEEGYYEEVRFYFSGNKLLQVIWGCSLN